MSRLSLRTFSCGPVLVLCSLFSLPAAAQSGSGTPAGVLWEMTSQITMEGMPYAPPPQTLKRCMPAQWTQPPTPEDDGRGCENSEFERFENTVSWTSTCAGPPEMAGQGEIVFEDETGQAYSGKIEYASDDGIVVIVLGGRVIGTCDKPR